jgi:hypothetical protein
VVTILSRFTGEIHTRERTSEAVRNTSQAVLETSHVMTSGWKLEKLAKSGWMETTVVVAIPPPIG